MTLPIPTPASCLPSAMGLLVWLSVAAGGGAGCHGTESAGCQQDGICPEGQVCDRNTGQCLEVPDPPATPELGRHTSLAVAADGTVWLATQTAGEVPALAVGHVQQGRELEVELLTEGPGIAEGTSIALFERGETGGVPLVLVAFHDQGRGRLMLAERLATGWSVEVADPGVEGGVGSYPSLALDEAGQPWIAYQDLRTGGLRIAHRAGDRWSSEAAATPVAGAGPWAVENSLVLVQGRPVVAHYDAGAGDLQMTLQEPAGGWRTVVIAGRDPVTEEDTGDVGRYPSATLDSFGNIALAYHDVTRGRLEYAYNQQGVLQREVVDDGTTVTVPATTRPPARVGQYAALAFGRGWLPRIAYLDAAHLDLVFAERRDGRWERRILAETGACGLWTTHAVDRQGNSVVVHTTLTPTGNRLARSLGVIWP